MSSHLAAAPCPLIKHGRNKAFPFWALRGFPLHVAPCVEPLTMNSK